MKDEVVSTNDKNFIVEALRKPYRLDGRSPYGMRNVFITFGKDLGQVEVLLGETRVMSVVTATVVAPRSNRPTEGFFQFQFEFSPMACMEFDNERKTADQVELGRIVERGLRDSRAVDTEALCIVAGEKVWAIKCHIHILDHGGNLIDCASLAAITSLLHFRRPDVTVVGDEVTIHSPKDKLPVPLSIHHIPISITFGIFDDGMLIVCDPSYKEEHTMDSSMTITLNAQGEICAVQKAGGTPLSIDRIMECTRIASEKVKDLDQLIKENLEEDSQRRKSNQPISIATTPARYTKHEKWEAIYEKDRKTVEMKATKIFEDAVNSNKKGVKKELESEDMIPLETNNNVVKKEEKKKKEDQEMAEVPIVANIKKEEKSDLFTGGTSSWNEEPLEVQKTTKKDEIDESNMMMDDDSEEEQTMTLTTENDGDLSMALKPKKKNKKKSSK